jgi:hypothetical protein
MWKFYDIFMCQCADIEKYPETEIKYKTSTIVPNPGLYPHRWNHGLPQFCIPPIEPFHSQW